MVHARKDVHGSVPTPLRGGVTMPRMDAVAAWLKLAGSIAGLVFFGLFAYLFLGACSAVDAGQDERAAAEAVTSTAAAPAGPPPSATFDVVDLTAGTQVQSGFDITDRYGIGARASAQRDTIEILRHFKTAYPDATQILITGYFPVKDEYGNTNDRAVLNVAYDRATVEKINFEEIDPYGIWDIRDGGGGMRSDFA
ncbi:hypothetical protein [Mycobacterium sp. CnD-18-1]|uniref:hypothetical protein n=1 Tax=Mycobacterium sp. CnD-18-1 TaxID=2917744 RepID=UPI001EF2F199|nr:hypothetical protein [Mycobacterium sp. CnD-18-1]MCG7610322.1 hypothetical protein [Mycobacterium sp. CnD-18-1]